MIDSNALPAFGFGDPRYCTYCGDPAESQDHIVPVIMTTTRRKANRSYGPWCWACRDCNTKVSTRYFDTFKARCEWQRDRLNALRRLCGMLRRSTARTGSIVGVRSILTFAKRVIRGVWIILKDEKFSIQITCQVGFCWGFQSSVGWHGGCDRGLRRK